MRILQGAAFMALMIGAAGVTGPDGVLQPAAVVIIAVSLIVLLAATTLEELRKEETRNGRSH